MISQDIRKVPHGAYVKATIEESEVIARISIGEDAEGTKYYYLCQNRRFGSGVFCEDKFGYNYCWGVFDGTPESLKKHDVVILELNYKFPSVKQRVDEYIESQDKSPLRFCDANGDVIKAGLRKNMKPTTLVKYILGNSRKYFSKNTDGIIETGPSRRRSSLDIWRHTKSVRDVSFYDIMEAIYDVVSGDPDLTQIYCCTIYRRVFFFDRNREHRDASEESDEFLLKFPDWKNIKTLIGKEMEYGESEVPAKVS